MKNSIKDAVLKGLKNSIKDAVLKGRGFKPRRKRRTIHRL